MANIDVVLSVLEELGHYSHRGDPGMAGGFTVIGKSITCSFDVLEDDEGCVVIGLYRRKPIPEEDRSKAEGILTVMNEDPKFSSSTGQKWMWVKITLPDRDRKYFRAAVIAKIECLPTMLSRAAAQSKVEEVLGVLPVFVEKFDSA